VVGASFLATAGLAVAGVRPPEPYSDIYEAVGFDVPGSDDPSEQQGSNREDASTTPEVGNAPGANGAGEDRPGRRQGQQPGHPSEEGQKTAEQARSGSTPPTDPGRSELHPVPPGLGPDADGPPGRSQSADPPGKSRAGGTPDRVQGSSWSAALTSPPGRTRRSLGPRGGLPAHALGTPAGGREKP
jgi:hypothetical protein